MTDQQSPAESAEASITDSATVGSEDDQDQDHDCQQHLEYIDYDWVGETYDDKYVCNVCGDEYRMVYAKAFLLDGDDYSLVEEYTDEIDDKLGLHRKREENESEESGEPADT